jgi:hypothetical protein
VSEGGKTLESMAVREKSRGPRIVEIVESEPGYFSKRRNSQQGNDRRQKKKALFHQAVTRCLQT